VERPDAAAPRATTSLRRVPKQARARERVGRILDAARAELEQRPVATITIEGIAERAEVPVGSLYQYFASKTELLAAVAEMVMAEADAQAAAQLAGSRGLPWREAVDRGVEATLGYLRDSSSYRQLVRTIRFTGAFAEVTAASNERVADLMSLHPAFARAGLSRERSLEICRTVVVAANAVQDHVLAQDLLDVDTWLAETRRLVKGYLSSYLP
jgi:AcrR family transcriptional regulator